MKPSASRLASITPSLLISFTLAPMRTFLSTMHFRRCLHKTCSSQGLGSADATLQAAAHRTSRTVAGGTGTGPLAAIGCCFSFAFCCNACARLHALKQKANEKQRPDPFHTTLDQCVHKPAMPLAVDNSIACVSIFTGTLSLRGWLMLLDQSGSPATVSFGLSGTVCIVIVYRYRIVIVISSQITKQ
jgi:hypothetical protein